MALNTEPALGASGAIFGVVGMYLVFFPLNTISCAYFFGWFLVIKAGTFSVSGCWMILYWVAFNVVCLLVGAGGVGYSAHLGGFTAGAVLAILLIKTGIVKTHRDELSLLQVIGIDPKPSLPELDVAGLEGRDRGMLTTSREIEGAAEAAAIRRQMVKKPPPPLVTGPAQAVDRDKNALREPEGDLIHFSCVCGKTFTVSAGLAGKRGRCPQCGATIEIPAPDKGQG
jgi:hypothetical protein